MIIVLKPGSSDADIDDVSRRVQGMGFKTHLSRGEVLSDVPQSLKLDKFARLMAELRPLAEVLGRSL